MSFIRDEDPLNVATFIVLCVFVAVVIFYLTTGRHLP